MNNDKTNSGSRASHVLNSDVDVNTGDTITVKLQCIDAGVYDCYYTLDQTLKQNSAVISNPKTNILGGDGLFLRTYLANSDDLTTGFRGRLPTNTFFIS